MHNILMISYYFPPQGGAGVQRSLKFVKFLPQYGWQPVVLTVREDTGTLIDTTLTKDIPFQTKVYRTNAVLLPKFLPWKIRNWISRWLFIVDEQIGWFPVAVNDAYDIIRLNNIEVIYTTSKPYTSHLIGNRLKFKTGLPWVADFRDPWQGNFATIYPTSLHKKWNSELEHRVIRTADAVTVVSPPMQQSLVERYPELDKDKIHTIPNGYDLDDFNGVIPSSKNPKIFTIVYSGSFYAHSLTPNNFLQGLKYALINGLIPRDVIQIFFIGNIGKLAQQQIDEMNLRSIVKSVGYVSHRDSISYLLSADVLLLIIGNISGSEAIYTGKIFEYLAAEKPILALAGHGAAADLIETSQAGVVVPPDDINLITQQIYRFYNLWKNNNLQYLGKREIITSFDRNKLTGRLATILNNLINI
jgi:glycosyltransferase involved in cell wall biosynthesis